MQEMTLPGDHDMGGLVGGRSRRPRDLSAILRGGKWLIGGFALAGMALAFVHVALTPRQYQSTADVMIDGRQNPASASQGSSSTPLEIAEVESQVELIHSAQIVGSALDALSPDVLQALDESHPSVFDLVKRSVVGAAQGVIGRLSPSQARPTVVVDGKRHHIDAVLAALSVRRIGSSYVVKVTYGAFDPKVAAAVANAVASAYVRYQVESKSELWRRASGWMQRRLEDLGAQASSAAKTAQEFKSSHSIIDTGRGLVNEQQLQEINTALLEAKAKAVEADSRYEEAKKIVGTGSIGTIPGMQSDTVMAGLREQAAALRQRAVQMEAQWGPDHEAVIRTKVDLKALEQTMFIEGQRLVQTLQSDRDVATARELSLERSFRDSVAKSGQTSQDRVLANELDRKAETYNSLYAGLLHRYTDAVDQESFPLATAQVISAAEPSAVATAPRAFVAIVLGVVIGAGLGMAIVFAFEATDGSLSAADDVEALGVPCYGLLPRLDRGSAFERQRRALADATGLSSSLSADRLRVDFLKHAPGSLFAHSIQSVRTHIVLAGGAGSNRIIGITSSCAGEGKSMIAGNLAHIFTRSDSRTLLIDADLYEPSMSGLFDLGDAPGLADILDGSATFREAARVAGDSGLTVLAAGHAHIDGVDFMLGSERMRDLLDEVRPLFDQIIIDLPPVGEVASTRELAPFLDGVVIVATWGSTRASALRHTLRAFARDRTNVFGVVLNRTAQRSLSSRSDYAAYRNRLRSRAAA